MTTQATAIVSRLDVVHLCAGDMRRLLALARDQLGILGAGDRCQPRERA